MLATLQHERHDRASRYVNRELGIQIGWVTDKENTTDHLPVVCGGGDVHIVLHGEIYPDEEIEPQACRAVKQRCYAGRVASLYDAMGGDFVSALNGWFSGAIIDLRAKSVTLFNDRYGMGRVYVHEAPDGFLFASEAKCLLKARPELRRLSRRSVAEFMRFDCVVQGKTLFEGITTLPSAAAWTFKAGAVTPAKQQYFRPEEWERQAPLGVDEFYEAFSRTVSHVVPQYLQDAGTVGLSLTAGLDTRLVLAAFQDRPLDNVECYTFGGTWGDTYDIRAGRHLASLLGRPFSVIRTDDTYLSEFARHARRSIFLSDGTHDVIGAHDVYFSERARAISHARVNGKFGSEVVRIRKLIPTCTYGDGLMGRDLQQEFAALPADPAPGFAHPLSRVVFAEIPWQQYGRIAIEQSQTMMRTPYMDNRLVRLMYRAPHATRGEGDLQAQYVRAQSPTLSRLTTNMGQLGNRKPWQSRLLNTPYWALFKVEYVYLYDTPHWLTRIDRALPGLHLERRLAGRQKFEGYRLWMKTHLADFMRDTLLSPRASWGAYLDQRSVQTMLARHATGTHNYLFELNKALTIELVHSQLLSATS